MNGERFIAKNGAQPQQHNARVRRAVPLVHRYSSQNQSPQAPSQPRRQKPTADEESKLLRYQSNRCRLTSQHSRSVARRFPENAEVATASSVIHATIHSVFLHRIRNLFLSFGLYYTAPCQTPRDFSHK